MKHSIRALGAISVLVFAAVSLLSSCRHDEEIVPAEFEALPDGPMPGAVPEGMYLLNEGNMGSNKSTLDYVDFRRGRYCRNIYAERNPDVIKELGDVGNDLAIYGSKLYTVINCSHKVEVMDAATGVRIAKIDIPNCRFLAFHEGNAYVSSYIGPVNSGMDSPRGGVYRIDTLSLQVTGLVEVGYQPEEMAVLDGKLYVANSGGYRKPHYDNTLSEIDLASFTQLRQIPVGINLLRVHKDRYNKLWISSRGDNLTIGSRIFSAAINPATGRLEVADTLDVPCSAMAIRGDSLYCISTEWSDKTASNSISYTLVDVRTHRVISDCFITDGTERDISKPYGIAINPTNGDVYITDAKYYVSSGTLNCYSRDGHRRWSIRTGDIPSSMAFR